MGTGNRRYGLIRLPSPAGCIGRPTNHPDCGPSMKLLLALPLLFAALLAYSAHAFAAGEAYPPPGDRMPDATFNRQSPHRLPVSGGELIIAFAPGELSLSREQTLAWIASSAHAVSLYYGRFPAARTRLLVVPRSGQGVGPGKAWGHAGATLRIAIGARATPESLVADWVLVHEMVHLALPAIADRHNWLHEGLASYVEAIARAQAGQIDVKQVWADLVAGLPKGLPEPGDRGLDNTPTWGRTYWGGALFCLLADLDIRRQTNNRFGLQHALRAMLAAGNMETASALAPLLALGDRAVDVPVLSTLYQRMKDDPAPVDLDALWRRLGVRLAAGGVVFDEHAPEAAIRRAITTPLAN